MNTPQPFPFLHIDEVPWNQYYCSSDTKKGAIPLKQLPPSILPTGLTSGSITIIRHATGQAVSGYTPSGSITSWTDPDTSEVIYYYTGGSFPGTQAGQTPPVAAGELVYAAIGSYRSPLFYLVSGLGDACQPVQIRCESDKRVGNFPPNVRMILNLDGRHGKTGYPLTEEVADTGDGGGDLLFRQVEKEWSLEVLSNESTLDGLAFASVFNKITFRDHRGTSYPVDPAGYSFGNPSWNQNGCLGTMEVRLAIASAKTANC